jgi:Na+-driven multidrug efflux pump
VLKLPVAAVWLSVPIAWALGFALSYGWIRSGIWQRVRL